MIDKDDYPFVVVPHLNPVFVVSDDFVRANPPVEEDGDRYFAGDHDYHSVLQTEDAKEYVAAKRHQWVAVAVLIDPEIEEEDDEEESE